MPVRIHEGYVLRCEHSVIAAAAIGLGEMLRAMT